jgi:hypothetical protein
MAQSKPLNIHEVRNVLYEAIQKDDESGLRRILSDFSYMIDNNLAYDAVNYSIRHSAPTALKTILSWRTGILTERYTTELLEGAIAGKNQAVWDMVYKGYKASGVKRVKASSLFSFAVKADWPEVAGVLSRELSPAEYGNILVATACKPAQELQRVLSYADYFRGDQGYLRQALCHAAQAHLMDNVDLIAEKGGVPCKDVALDILLKGKIQAGEDEAAIRLLSYGADPNSDQGEAMCIAMAKNNPAMLDHLIAKGGDIEQHCEAIVRRISVDYPEAKVFPNVQALVDKARNERMRREEEKKYTLADPYTLSYEMKLKDSMVLTTLFNFKLRQQVSIIQDAKNNRLSMDVKSFDEVLGDDEIANLREKLTARGGKVDYSYDGKKSQKPPLGKTPG